MRTREMITDTILQNDGQPDRRAIGSLRHALRSLSRENLTLLEMVIQHKQKLATDTAMAECDDISEKDLKQARQGMRFGKCKPRFKDPQPPKDIPDALRRVANRLIKRMDAQYINRQNVSGDDLAEALHYVADGGK